MYVFMPIDTSKMSVLSILEAEEKIIKEKKKGSLHVVSEEDRNEMIAVTQALNLILKEHEIPDSLRGEEKIALLLTYYPELNDWLAEACQHDS